MNTISSYLTNKGLELIWGTIQDSFNESISTDTLSNQMEIVNKKLDMLINAPYKAANLYLREGNIDKYKDKIIEIISIDELNLIAQIAYIKLLIAENKKEIAFEQYWNILEKYGCIEEIVPKKIIEEFKKYNCKDVILQKKLSILPGSDEKILERYFVSEIWISRNIFAVKWEINKKPWSIFSKHHWRKYIISAINTDNKYLFNIGNDDIEIVNITNHFAVINHNYKLRLFDIEGKEIDKFSQEQIQKLFCKSSINNKITSGFKNNNKFGDINFTTQKYKCEYQYPTYENESSTTWGTGIFHVEGIEISTQK